MIGFIDTVTAVSVPGIELVTACDLYNGQLERDKYSGIRLYSFVIKHNR